MGQRPGFKVHVRLAVALCAFLMVLCPAAGARDVTGLHGAAVPVADRSPEALARGAAAALSQVLVKLTGNRRVAAQGGVGSLLAKASRLMLQYGYETAPTGELLLRAEFDEHALATELADRGIAVWGKERPDTLVWLIVDDGMARELATGDEPGEAGEALLAQAAVRGLPLLLPLGDIEEAQRLGTGEGAALEAAALELSARYGTPATLVGQLVQTAPGLWEARWKLALEGDTLAWNQEGDALALVAGEAVDALGDALARRYADPVMLAASDRLSVSVYGVRSAADYARLLRYLDSLDTIRDLFLESVDGQRLAFGLTARGGRAALAQSIAFGQVLAPVPGKPDAYQLLH
jgi:hypothetical protein